MFLTIQPATGPACPDCGCRDSTILSEADEASWWEQGEARCGHCGRRFRFAKSERHPAVAAKSPGQPVVRERLRCPNCHSVEVRAYVTRPQRSQAGKPLSDGWVVRYCKCLACDKRFKSVEQ